MKLRIVASLLGWAVTALTTFAASGTAIPGGVQSAAYVINKPGSYYLAANRIMTGNDAAIRVEADDVTLDLNGCSLSGPLAGIYGSNHSNLEIRNGSIGPCTHGVDLSSYTVVRVHDLRVSDCTGSGIVMDASNALIDRCSTLACSHHGIKAWASGPNGTIVRNCIVKDSGWSGIEVGADARVAGCTVTSSGYSGIDAGEHSIVEDNIVNVANTNEVAYYGGILVTQDCVVRHNLVNGARNHGICAPANVGGVAVEGNTVLHVVAAPYQVAVGVSFVSSEKTLLSQNHFHDVGKIASAPYVDGGGNILY